MNDQLRTVAKVFAFDRYQKDHPGNSAELAHAFAARAWPGFVALARKFLALRAILREQAAAPFN